MIARKGCKRLNRDSECIPRRLSQQSGDPAIGEAGLTSELEIGDHPYGEPSARLVGAK